MCPCIVHYLTVWYLNSNRIQTYIYFYILIETSHYNTKSQPLFVFFHYIKCSFDFLRIMNIEYEFEYEYDKWMFHEISSISFFFSEIRIGKICCLDIRQSTVFNILVCYLWFQFPISIGVWSVFKSIHYGRRNGIKLSRCSNGSK